MRYANIYSTFEIKRWSTEEEYKKGLWRPARCCPFSGFSLHLILVHLCIVWRVFTGRYDALTWEWPFKELPDNRTIGPAKKGIFHASTAATTHDSANVKIGVTVVCPHCSTTLIGDVVQNKRAGGKK